MFSLIFVFTFIFQSSQTDVTDILSYVVAALAITLFTLSLFAWSRRHQTSLILVALAFLLFFVKSVIELIPNFTDTLQVITTLIDVLILLFFFLSVVLPREFSKNKPRKEKSHD